MIAQSEFSLQYILGLLFSGIAWSLPPWDREVMSSGVYYRPEAAITRLEQLEQYGKADNTLLYYAEGLDGTVTVKIQDDNRFLVPRRIKNAPTGVFTQRSYSTR